MKTKLPHGARMTGKELGAHFSEGARQLWRVLEKLQISVEAMRQRIDVPRGNLNRYLYGLMTPGIHVLVRIEEEFGIDPRLFAKAPRRPFVPPGARERKAA